MGISLPIAAQSQETLICLADLSTGFQFKNGNWTIANFTTGNDRFIVKPLTQQERLIQPFNYIVTRIGESTATHECNRRPDSSQMICGGLGIGMIVNFTTLRFQEIYGLGFIDGNDRPGGDTPAMTIGKCSKVS
jgi:uncharacterized protein YerC